MVLDCHGGWRGADPACGSRPGRPAGPAIRPRRPAAGPASRRGSRELAGSTGEPDISAQLTATMAQRCCPAGAGTASMGHRCCGNDIHGPRVRFWWSEAGPGRSCPSTGGTSGSLLRPRGAPGVSGRGGGLPWMPGMPVEAEAGRAAGPVPSGPRRGVDRNSLPRKRTRGPSLWPGAPAPDLLCGRCFLCGWSGR